MRLSATFSLRLDTLVPPALRSEAVSSKATKYASEDPTISTKWGWSVAHKNVGMIVSGSATVSPQPNLSSAPVLDTVELFSSPLGDGAAVLGDMAFTTGKYKWTVNFDGDRRPVWVGVASETVSFDRRPSSCTDGNKLMAGNKLGGEISKRVWYALCTRIVQLQFLARISRSPRALLP